MSLTYFAADGNYGDANGIVIIDTTNWTDADWDVLEQQTDNIRPRAAITISQRGLLL